MQGKARSSWSAPCMTSTLAAFDSWTSRSAVEGKAMRSLRRVVLRAFAALLSTSAAAQGVPASDPPPFVVAPMLRIVPYQDDSYVAADALPVVPSCYRVGRCSAYDLYRFRDRPNRLTRLAPEAPVESVVQPPSIEYRWILVPVTPEENITPKYRTVSKVRDEYSAVGTPIGEPN